MAKNLTIFFKKLPKIFIFFQKIAIGNFLTFKCQFPGGTAALIYFVIYMTPLLCLSASIMSKKVAESIKSLVLDVKTGSGAMIPEEEGATKLAESMVRYNKLFINLN